MKRSDPSAPAWRSVLITALIYGALALVFTFIGMVFGPSEAQQGGTRPEDSIPLHIAALAAFGLLLGLGCVVIYGRKGLPLVVLMPVLTVVLDIDHLPAYLGYAQPIRPAHSLIFIVFALAAIAISIRAPYIVLVAASSFMGHLAVDTGLFAPFSPINLDYLQLDPFRLPLAAGAILSALAAGALLRKRTRDQGGVGPAP